jgi:hypothetical protein
MTGRRTLRLSPQPVSHYTFLDRGKPGSSARAGLSTEYRVPSSDVSMFLLEVPYNVQNLGSDNLQSVSHHPLPGLAILLVYNALSHYP